jgi:biopolymer transport protein ExbB
VAIWPSLLELARSGGWVMFPLGAVSLVMWTLIAERMITFRGLTRHDMGIQDAVHAMQGSSVNHFGNGLRATLTRNFSCKRTGEPDLDRRILSECALMMQPMLNRNLSVIAVLGSVAPLLGLLGTVSGMIRTFSVISAIGTGNARPLAGGISEALVATEAGLLVAIPGLLLSASLSRRASRLAQHLDQTTLVLEHHIH